MIFLILGIGTALLLFCFICFLWLLNEHFAVHHSLQDRAQLSSLNCIFPLVLLGSSLFLTFCMKWLSIYGDTEPQCVFLLM